MTRVKCAKYEILSGILFLSALMLSITPIIQILVFAQITPATQKFGSNDSVGGDGSGATDNSQETGTGNDNNPQPITPSEAESDVTTEESTDSIDSNDINSGVTPTEQDDRTIPTEEHGSDPTSQLVEEIMNKVDKVLSASGIIGP
jgi:cytoskeletal protein RodZ